MKKYLFLILVICSTAAQSRALFPEAELIEFSSIASTLDRSSIVRQKPNMQQPLFGYFFKSVTGRRSPTLVYMHSSSGLFRNLLTQWVEPLITNGYNVFLIDSFTPRRIGTTTADQTQLFDYTMVIDAFRELQAISQRSEVDVQRVAIMGGSKGGIVAYQTLYKEYRDASQIGALSFKLHIPLYPTCNWNDWTENYTSGKVAALLGGSDDFTPASLCIEHFKRMISAGATVQWAVYDGYHHGFDNGQGARFIPNAATSRNCGVYVDLKDLKVKQRNGAVVINDAGAHYKRCNERGAHTGGTQEQARRVVSDVLKILRDDL